MVPRRRCVPGLPGVAALAGWDQVPALPEPRGMAAGEWPVGVRGVRAPGIGDRGDDLSSQPDAAATVVRGGVADDQPEARGLGAGGAAVARAGLLPDRVGDVA